MTSWESRHCHHRDKCQKQEVTSHLWKVTAYWTIDHVGNWTVQQYQCPAVQPHLIKWGTAKLQRIENKHNIQSIHLTFSFQWSAFMLLWQPRIHLWISPCKTSLLLCGLNDSYGWRCFIGTQLTRQRSLSHSQRSAAAIANFRPMRLSFSQPAPKLWK